MFFFFRGKRLKTERKIHTVSKYLLDSIFWAKVLGQWSSHQLPSNVRWGSKMSFPLLFRRSRNIFVQFHGESGPWYDSEIKKPVSVWSCLCNLIRDCNNLSLFARQCKSWWGTILTKMVPEQLDGKNLSEIDRTQDNHNQIAEGIFNGFKYYFLRKHTCTHAPTNFYQKFHMMYFIYKLLCILNEEHLFGFWKSKRELHWSVWDRFKIFVKTYLREDIKYILRTTCVLCAQNLYYDFGNGKEASTNFRVKK